MVYDIVCFSHLRWDFVFQRPQHLLSRCARERRVFFIEEPVEADRPARLEVSSPESGVWVVRPHLPGGMTPDQQERTQQVLLRGLVAEYAIERYVAWYYTPMALGVGRHFTPLATVYDCMDELSLFAGAPPLLRERERALLRRADLVFTGGQSLYVAKRTQHRRVFAFPSSVDAAHFARARRALPEPAEHQGLNRPRLGFYGVVDERMDLELLGGIAELRPEWQIVVVGPVVKIDAESLPRHSNIHYLGMKSYAALPEYLAGWDVAIMPFAHNNATRYISPTKTLEYLAAGKPIVSTGIADVVSPYGRLGLAHIAEGPEPFVRAVEEALAADPQARLRLADAYLATTSWDRTWQKMQALIDGVIEMRLPRIVPLQPHLQEVSPRKGAGKIEPARVLKFPTVQAEPVRLRAAQGEAE